jgi:hypothetical protein
VIKFLFLFLVALGFELRASHLSHSTSPNDQILILFFFFWSQEILFPKRSVKIPLQSGYCLDGGGERETTLESTQAEKGKVTKIPTRKCAGVTGSRTNLFFKGESRHTSSSCYFNSFPFLIDIVIFHVYGLGVTVPIWVYSV